MNFNLINYKLGMYKTDQHQQPTRVSINIGLVIDLIDMNNTTSVVWQILSQVRWTLLRRIDMSLAPRWPRWRVPEIYIKTHNVARAVRATHTNSLSRPRICFWASLRGASATVNFHDIVEVVMVIVAPATVCTLARFPPRGHTCAKSYGNPRLCYRSRSSRPWQKFLTLRTTSAS